MSGTTTRQRPYSCAWCGREMLDSPHGRHRKYCKRSCRQRAYEQRTRVEGTAIPAEALILSPDEVMGFADRLFALRCAAEDLHTALAEGDDPADLVRLADDLVTAAREAERLR